MIFHENRLLEYLIFSLPEPKAQGVVLWSVFVPCPSGIRGTLTFFFKWHLLLNHLSKFEITLQECCSQRFPLSKLNKWFRSTNKLQIRNLLNNISSWTTGQSSKLFHRIVPHDAFYQHFTNGSAQPNKEVARVLDRKRVQIQNNFTELFLFMPYTKIAQTGSLHKRKGLPTLQIRTIFKQHLLNHWPSSKELFPNAFFDNYTNGSAHWNKGATRALDSKFLLMTFPPESTVLIQNHFTELFLMMAATIFAQTVSLGLIQGLPKL